MRDQNKRSSNFTLYVIVIAQFCCTSLWFAGNAVMPELINAFQLNSNALSMLTSAVQFGFILGTLAFAFLSLADKFSPSKIFFVCAILGAVFNVAGLLEQNNIYTLSILRFLTGFSLAGIYPIGMKIAADYYEKGLGRSLGFLVGALVLGTGLPHLLKATSDTIEFNWKVVLITTSSLAITGGLLLKLLVPDGPFRKPYLKTSSHIPALFSNNNFRSAAFGYFGHMWELYAFWAFVPLMLQTYNHIHGEIVTSISLYSFFIIGAGGLSCALSGILSERFGVARTAKMALIFSGSCCIISPLILIFAPPILFISFLIFWGVMVIADSPLFSTLIAKAAPAEGRGTALTLVNSLGYALTIISIQLVSMSWNYIEPQFSFLLLAAGPLIGVLSINGYQNKID